MEFQYNAKPVDVTDGDTIDMRLDLGFYIWITRRLRLDGIDTHEIHNSKHESEEYRMGMEEKEFVEQWLVQGESNTDDSFSDYDKAWPFVITITEYDHTGKYGRTIGHVLRKTDGKLLGECLVEEFGPEIVYEE